MHRTFYQVRSARLSALIGLLLIALGSMAGLRLARAQDATPDPSGRITNPSDGMQIFGVVSITGTAANPQFQSYRLDYLSTVEPTAGWQPIGRLVTQQVRAGTLGQWDTTAVKDGVYDIRLRVILRNATVLEDYVRGVVVQNEAPTPLPTQPLVPTVTNTSVGPTATLLIQQPPTTTPRQSSFATATVPPRTVAPMPTAPGAGGPTAAPLIQPGPVSTPTVLSGTGGGGGGALSGAFCGGAILGALGIGVYGAYNAVRGRLRRAR